MIDGRFGLGGVGEIRFLDSVKNDACEDRISGEQVGVFDSVGGMTPYKAGRCEGVVLESTLAYARASTSQEYWQNRVDM